MLQSLFRNFVVINVGEVKDSTALVTSKQICAFRSFCKDSPEPQMQPRTNKHVHDVRTDDNLCNLLSKEN